MHEALISDDGSEGVDHGQGVIHLHANFERVEDVAREAVGDPREGAADHVSCEVCPVHPLRYFCIQYISVSVF